MKSNKLYKLCISIFLLILIFCRLFSSNDNVPWISSISFLGVCIAFIDVYKCIKNNHSKPIVEKIYKIIGLFVILIIIFISIFGLIYSGIITPSNKWNDIFTLLALFFSLPKDLYCELINKFIK